MGGSLKELCELEINGQKDSEEYKRLAKWV